MNSANSRLLFEFEASVRGSGPGRRPAEIMADPAKSAVKRKAGSLASPNDKKHKHAPNRSGKPVRDANQKAVQKLMAKEAPKENLSKCVMPL